MSEKEKTLKLHVGKGGPAKKLGSELFTIPLCGRPVPAKTVMPQSILQLWAEHRIYCGPICRSCITKSGIHFEEFPEDEEALEEGTLALR